jgi:hypothetical protein
MKISAGRPQDISQLFWASARRIFFRDYAKL